MTFELSDTEAIYLYGKLRKELKNLESVKPSSLVKADVNLYKRIISKMETAAPQLKELPI